MHMEVVMGDDLSGLEKLGLLVTKVYAPKSKFKRTLKFVLCVMLGGTCVRLMVYHAVYQMR